MHKNKKKRLCHSSVTRHDVWGEARMACLKSGIISGKEVAEQRLRKRESESVTLSLITSPRRPQFVPSVQMLVHSQQTRPH
eukprot:5919945-Amphidinium_carterae.1